eukprot:scaffold37050_cov199-Amphora_coffeaeformis.AAC.1
MKWREGLISFHQCGSIVATTLYINRRFVHRSWTPPSQHDNGIHVLQHCIHNGTSRMKHHRWTSLGTTPTTSSRSIKHSRQSNDAKGIRARPVQSASSAVSFSTRYHGYYSKEVFCPKSLCVVKDTNDRENELLYGYRSKEAVIQKIPGQQRSVVSCVCPCFHRRKRFVRPKNERAFADDDAKINHPHVL